MAFNLTNTFSQSKKPFTGPTPWVRPSDWPAITDNADRCQFLVCDYFWSNYAMSTSFVAPAAQNLYIDWGDGTINTIGATGATTTTHTYATGGTGGTGGTPSSRGYNTWVVKVYTDSGGTVLAPYFLTSNGLGDAFLGRTQGVLEIVYGNNVQFNTTTAPTTAIPSMNAYLLEYVKFPNVLVGNGATTFPTLSYDGSLVRSPNLAKVVMPTSASAFTNWTNAFYGCYALQGTVVIPADCTAISTFASAFFLCTNLLGVTLPATLPSCTAFTATFQNSGISNIIFPSLPIIGDMSNAFTTCKNLTYVRFTDLPGTGSCNFGNTFNGCGGLKYVFFPSTIGMTGGNQWTMSNTFNGCRSLETLTFPTGFNTTSLASVFTQCTNLLSCTFQGPCGSLTNMLSAFSGCTSLQSVTLPTTSGSSVMTQAFNGCTALSSLSFPPGFNLVGCGLMCLGCTALQTVVLPQSAQPLMTFAQQMFSGCTALTSVTWPTATTGVTDMTSIFLTCTSLESIAFPATMNSVTTMTQAFQSCLSLTSVTLPTSMTALTGTAFNATFSSCQNLKTIVFPATVGTGITAMFTMIQGSGIQTVTLPTTQMTSIGTMVTAFQNCPNLKTINNMDKIGNNSTVGTIVNGLSVFNGSPSLSSINLACRLSTLNATTGTSATSLLTSIRLTNTGTGQWTVSSPQINISYSGLSTAALNILFADIAAQGTVTSKTIQITGTVGAAGLTAGDRLVLTSRGWTITG